MKTRKALEICKVRQERSRIRNLKEYRVGIGHCWGQINLIFVMMAETIAMGCICGNIESSGLKLMPNVFCNE